MTGFTDLQFIFPSDPQHVHLIGICGVGMAGVASLFLSKGAKVTGSDQAVYPPMSEHLARLGLQIRKGYSASNLSPVPNLVVIGNVIRSDNPEVKAAIDLGIPITSMPGAISKYFLHDKLCLVVAGSHGKTTLSSMIAWILYNQGLEPGFMIGGLVHLANSIDGKNVTYTISVGRSETVFSYTTSAAALYFNNTTRS
ncbi:MAG: Mur ligase domain-containing protein, partial [Desulfomonilaceae bacterium]